ncbi:MAG: citrate lyase ACP [Treponemataceae bacterium]
MVGKSGGEKDDVFITIDLSYTQGILIEIVSKMENLYGNQIKLVIKSVLQELNITNAKVICEDNGGLDFVIRSRVKSAVRKAKEAQNG